MKDSWYSEQLKDKRWKYKSLEIKMKSKMTCQLCGYVSPNLSRLVVHHRKYISGKMPWEYDDEDLMCLCRECHRMVHMPEIRQKELEDTKLINIIGKLYGTP